MCARFQDDSRLLLSCLFLLLLAAPLGAQPAYYTFHGDFPGDRMGSSVAVAGDVNNDGVLDILVGAPNSDGQGNRSGLIRVYSGQDGSILFTLEGESANDVLGLSVSGAGDVNADGFDDVIAGAPFDDFNGLNLSGSAWVCAGPTGSILHIFGGTDRFMGLGTSVSGLGDVNGDGHSDLLVGSPGGLDNWISAGAARVYSGLDGSLLHLLPGDTVRCLLGTSVSGLGDVDNDGVADLIAGAPGNSRNGGGSGRANVYSGASGTKLLSFDGTSAGDRLGKSVRGAGDVNADGIPDVIVGAPNSDTSIGLVRVYSGQDGSTLHEFNGEEAGEYVGLAIDGAGDVNADGYADLILGVARNDDRGRNAGLVRIHSGLDGSYLSKLYGRSEFENFGGSVSGMPDIDGDGHDDVLVGVPGDDFNGSQSGSARVYVQRCGIITEIGSGCVGTGGYVPELAVTFSSECLELGSSLTFEITKGLGGLGVPAALLVSPSEGTTTLPNGCTLDVALSGSVLIFLGYLSGFGDGNGTINFSTPPILQTRALYMQGLIGDSFVGTVATNGLWVFVPA